MNVGTLEERLAVMEAKAEAVPERNSEKWGYIAACVLATVALYLELIDATMWCAIIGIEPIAYGLGRVVLKKA